MKHPLPNRLASARTVLPCLLAAALTLAPGRAPAMLWPVVTDVRITDCKDGVVGGAGDGPCSVWVYYTGVVQFLEMGRPTEPEPAPGRPRTGFVGLHCNYGRFPGQFSGCMWKDYGDQLHAPQSNNCDLLGNTWTSGINPQCTFGTTWGGHTGAGPGAECAIFGIKLSQEVVATPFGRYSATAVANSGSGTCVKSLPPDVTCTTGVLPEITHGTLQPDAQDTLTVSVPIQCGADPVVTIVGDPELHLADGLVSRLTAKTEGSTSVNVTSSLTAHGAPPGTYQGASILVISPM